MKTLVLIALLAASLPASAQAQDTSKSPDGLYTVSIVPNGAGDENGSGAEALVLYSTKSNLKRRLLVSKWDGDYARNLANLSKPLFSLDGGYVYFNSSDASPNSSYVHQFDLKLNA
ncbi:hypothetical protein DC429_19120, partial [Arthrobacter sp. TPD3018]